MTAGRSLSLISHRICCEVKGTGVYITVVWKQWRRGFRPLLPKFCNVCPPERKFATFGPYLISFTMQRIGNGPLTTSLPLRGTITFASASVPYLSFNATPMSETKTTYDIAISLLQEHLESRRKWVLDSQHKMNSLMDLELQGLDPQLNLGWRWQHSRYTRFSDQNAISIPRQYLALVQAALPSLPSRGKWTLAVGGFRRFGW